ncbi:PH domain-containing protein [Isoptericola croceus]|uniref:PH domain-containing protein n=1 Tax=Isoptericola croceus TaxID=3031406 RepID=UPI0023F6346E|nr:PH domain-containing protein [Isoptericola croceus]
MEPTTKSIEEQALTFASASEDLVWLLCRVSGPLTLLLVTLLLGQDGVLVIVVFAVACLVVIGVRPPEVQVSPAGIVVRNPLVTYRIPWPAVEGLDVRKHHEVKVLTRGRDVRCVALRKDGLADLLGRQSRVDRAVSDILLYRRSVRHLTDEPGLAGAVERSVSARPMACLVALLIIAGAITLGMVIRHALGG